MLAIDTRTRRAALALHALNEQDRTRVLTLLSDAQRQRLHPVLSELTELGIPAHADFATATQAPADPLTAKERVARLRPTEVAPVLQVLSPLTAAALVRLEPWPWMKEVMEAIPEPRRAWIASLQDTVPMPGPRLVEALCVEFEAAAKGRPLGSRPFRESGFAALSRLWSWTR